MCNLYALRSDPSALGQRFDADARALGNWPDQASIFPGGEVAIVRGGGEGGAGRQILRSTWGWPHWKDGARPLTNVRNTDSPFWRRFVRSAKHRCLVPFTAFAEYHPTERNERGHKKVAWFAASEDRPILAFAGICKAAEPDGPGIANAFLTTDPNAEVAPIHPKAMPAILTGEEEFAAWLGEDDDAALALQRPLPDGTLRLVHLGGKNDPGAGS